LILGKTIMAEDKEESGTAGRICRRGLITGLLGVLAGGWPVAVFGQGYGLPGYGGPAPPYAPPYGKIPKAVAHYQYYPNDGMRCGFCRFYRGGACAIVAGRIPPYGWCRFFRPA
jgi:hypothetical protein